MLARLNGCHRVNLDLEEQNPLKPETFSMGTSSMLPKKEIYFIFNYSSKGTFIWSKRPKNSSIS